MTSWIELLTAGANRAYLVALRAAGEPALAEEAVQEACARLLRGPLPELAPEQRLTYWLRTVHHTAVDMARASTARRKREEEYAMAARQTAPAPDEAAALAETARAARAALAGLPLDLRQAVSLCCEQGLTHRQAAEVLGVPERTITDWVNRGLDRLRQALVAGGFAACASAALGRALGALGVPEAPAGLAARLHDLAAGFQAPAGASTGTGTGAVLKGGLIVKVGIGMAVAGLVAGTTLWAVGGNSGESHQAPEKARKFATPVWHPDARWEIAPERFAGLTWAFYNTGGSLDGPRREVMWRGSRRPSLCGGLMASGRYYFMSYDEKTERFHGVTGGQAAGDLDGPFSRARFGCTEYFPRQGLYEVQSPDKRCVYVVTAFDRKTALRCMDFEKQTVRTLPTGKGRPLNVSVDGQGKLYVVTYPDYELLIMDPAQDWKPVRTVALKAEEKLHLLSCSLAADGVHDRLYATAYGPKSWYVWYWDTKDGSFHGVVPTPQAGAPHRPGGMEGATPGPFKGVVFYNEGSVSFGPDDPEKRFLYMGRIDDRSLYRLDLVKEVVWAFDPKVGAFVDQGAPRRPEVLNLILPVWMEDGSFLGSPVASDYRLYRRVK